MSNDTGALAHEAGSSAEVEGKRKVPKLNGFKDERNLNLNFWVSKWVDDCRFLFVRTGST